MCGPCAWKKYPHEYPKKVAGTGGTWQGDKVLDFDAKEVQEIKLNNNTFLIGLVQNNHG